MSTKKRVLAVFAAVLIIFILSPLSRYVLSLGVMSVYSGIHEKNSIMAEKGIELDIPGGDETPEKDWYPFVMTFNPGSSFGREAGDSSLKLTIMYNFGAFDLTRGCSILYDTESEYYNSFYGAYLVTRTDGESGTADSTAVPFGFDAEGHIVSEQTAIVPKFDFQKLVLGDFGIMISEQVFEWTAENVTENVKYLGYDDWSRVDAELIVNGAAHVRDGFRQSYLQYGSPGYEVDEEDEFAPVAMRGRIYGRYFEECDTSVFFYILTPQQDTLEKCDQDIVSKSLFSVEKGNAE